MFYFALAEKLHMPVGEMLRRMSSRELQEWRAYFALRREEVEGPKMDGPTALRAWFGDRIIKKD